MANQVYRLTDIEVEEVSLVDRPANKRKFLIVKRSEESMTTKNAALVPDGKGGFMTPAATPPASAATPPAATDKAKKAGLELPPGAKEAMTPHIDRAMTALEALQAGLKSATPAELPEDGSIPGVPAEFFTMLGSVRSSLDQLERMFPKSGPSDTPAADAPAAAEGTEMAEKLEALKKEVVTKLGAKMSKERLGRFENALSVLGSILGELQTGGAPPDPTAGATKTAKSEGNTEMEKLIADLTASVKSLTAVVKRQDGELKVLKSARGAGNAIPTGDGAGTPSKGDEAEVSWPLDMNSPVRKGADNKETFFGED